MKPVRQAVEVEVQRSPQSVHIIVERREVAAWTRDEWEEDPDLTYIIVNAVTLALTDPGDLLERLGYVLVLEDGVPHVRGPLGHGDGGVSR